MNKPILKIDQLVREEYLKLKKEEYLKSVINDVISEQKYPKSINIKPNMLGGEANKNIVLPILSAVGFDVNYAGNIKFPTLEPTDPLYYEEFPIVDSDFASSKKGPGVHFKDVRFGDGGVGNRLHDFQIGSPLFGGNLEIKQYPTGSGYIDPKTKNPFIQSVRIHTKRVAFNISGLGEDLNSLYPLIKKGNRPPFTEDQLKNQYILNPNGKDAYLQISYHPPLNRTRMDGPTPNLQQFDRNLNDPVNPSNNLNISSTVNPKGSGIFGTVDFDGLYRTKDDPIYKQTGGFWSVRIHIEGTLLPLYSKKVTAKKRDDDLAPNNWKQRLVIPRDVVPTTQGETTPDAMITLLSPEEKAKYIELERNMEQAPDEYKNVLRILFDKASKWFSSMVPEWLKKTGSFLAWCVIWLAKNNPISQMITNPSLDNFQNILNWGGFIDVFFIGTIIDLVNAVISLCRYGYDGSKRHLLEAALSILAAIPIGGWAINFVKAFKGAGGAGGEMAIRKMFTVSPKQAKFISTLNKDKTFKKYMSAVVKGDVKGMADALAKLVKDGKMTREQLQWLRGSDGINAAALYLASGTKSLKEFAKWIEKINKSLPAKQKFDLDWVFESLDKASNALNLMQKATVKAYQITSKKTLPQAVGNIAIETVSKGTRATVKLTGNIVKGAARLSGAMAIWGSITPLFAVGFFRLAAKSKLPKLYGKIFNRKSLVKFGDDIADFSRMLWKQDLWENTGKLSLLLNNSLQVSVKNFDNYLAGNFVSRYIKSGKAAQKYFGIGGKPAVTQLGFLDLFNKITGSSFSSVSKIPKTTMDAFLSNLRAGSFKTVKGMPSSFNLGSIGLGGKAQKELYKDICNAVATSTTNARNPIWLQFKESTIKNIFSGKLKRYWTREAVQQQGYLVMINGIFSIKFADIAFKEMNDLFKSVGLGWGQSPAEAEKARAEEGVSGFLLKFIYDASKKYEIPFEKQLRQGKNFVISQASPYIQSLKMNSGITADMVQYGIERWSSGVENDLRARIMNSPGLRGDINNTSTAELIAPSRIQLGEKSIPNPFTRMVYTGPNNHNQELYADSGKIEPIGNAWHTGDGETGKEVEYWRAPLTGFPTMNLTSVLQFDLDADPKTLKVPLSKIQKGDLYTQIIKLKDIAPELSKFNREEPQEYIFYPGPPTDQERVNFITSFNALQGEDPSVMLNVLRKLFPQLSKYIPKGLISTNDNKPELEEQDFQGPFGKEHDYSDYGGPWGDPGHKTDFKKGPGKAPTKSISHGRPEEDDKDDRETGYKIVSEDPKKGTGKKPKGSGRRLYTDENPKDTVSVKFKTKQDVIDTLNKSSFKSKSHARQSQIINLIHQRLRVAVERTKDPEKKKRLQSAYDYIKKKKEASKEKTKRLNKENFADGKNPGRKGLSQRVGIPKNATIAQLEKAAKADGEKGRLARWQLNMRQGKKKKK